MEKIVGADVTSPGEAPCDGAQGCFSFVCFGYLLSPFSRAGHTGRDIIFPGNSDSFCVNQTCVSNPFVSVRAWRHSLLFLNQVKLTAKYSSWPTSLIRICIYFRDCGANLTPNQYWGRYWCKLFIGYRQDRSKSQTPARFRNLLWTMNAPHEKLETFAWVCWLYSSSLATGAICA